MDIFRNSLPGRCIIKFNIVTLIFLGLYTSLYAQRSDIIYVDFSQPQNIYDFTSSPKLFLPDFELTTSSGEKSSLYTIIDSKTLIYTGCGWQFPPRSHPLIKKTIDSSNRQDIKTIFAYWIGPKNDKINYSWSKSSNYYGITNEKNSICEYVMLVDKNKSVLFFHVGKFLGSEPVDILKNILLSSH